MVEGEPFGGRYRVLSRVAAGGMGHLFRCQDELLRRVVAVKTLAPGLHHRGDDQRRMLREARALAAIRHPSVVPVFDAGTTDDGGVFIVMELVEGRSLRARLDEGPLPVDRAAALASALAGALDHVHEAELVHRDIKPENVMLRPDGTPVLVDFGLAKRSGDSGGEWDTRDATVTQAGRVVGTPGYIAPEQLRGGAAGPASDQFQLAVALFEATSGRLPWSADSAEGLMMQTYAVPPRRLTEVDPSAPPTLDPVFERALAWNPSDRFPTASAFADAFRSAVGASAPPPGPSQQDTRPHTAPGPVGARTSGAARLAGRRGTHPALLGFALLVPAIAWAAWQKWTPPDTPPDDARLAVVLAPPDATLGCPMWRADGEGVDGWLLAAAADAACRRALWSLGRDPTRVSPPGELLGLPRTIGDAFPPLPYDGGDARERTLREARVSTTAWLEGTVGRRGDVYEVSLSLRAAPDRASAAYAARSPMLWEAAFDAVDAMVDAGVLPPREVSSQTLALWSGDLDRALFLERAEYALATGHQVGEVCAWFDDRARDPQLAGFLELCAAWGTASVGYEVDPATLDEVPGDPAELAYLGPLACASAQAEEPQRAAWLDAMQEARRITDDAEAYVGLAISEAFCMVYAGRRDEARRLLTSVTELWPSSVWAWDTLSLVTSETRAATARAYAAWAPSWPAPWCSMRRDAGAELRSLATRRCHELAPGVPQYGMVYAREIAESDRVADLRALAARYAHQEPPSPIGAAFIDALADASEGGLRRAFDRMEAALLALDVLGGPYFVTGSLLPLRWFLRLGELLGEAEDAAGRLARAHVLVPEPRLARMSWYAVPAALAVCVFAPPRMRAPCVARIDAYVEAEDPPTLEHTGTCLEGARAYARGDLHGALEVWRSLPRSALSECPMPLERLAAALGVDAVARLEPEPPDVLRFHGLSLVDVRAIQRAARRGDRAAARRRLARVTERVRELDVAPPTPLRVPELRALSTEDAAER